MTDLDINSVKALVQVQSMAPMVGRRSIISRVLGMMVVMGMPRLRQRIRLDRLVIWRQIAHRCLEHGPLIRRQRVRVVLGRHLLIRWQDRLGFIARAVCVADPGVKVGRRRASCLCESAPFRPPVHTLRQLANEQCHYGHADKRSDDDSKLFCAVIALQVRVLALLEPQAWCWVGRASRDGRVGCNIRKDWTGNDSPKRGVRWVLAHD